MEGISLGSAFLRLYGDRSALDRELAVLKRYTDQLEKQGIKVRFDADTGQATREIDGLKNKLNSLNDILRTVGQGLQGDSGAWAGLQQALGGVAGGAGGAGGAMGKLGGALGGALGMAGKALPVLGQLGLAAQGLQAIFFGVSAAVNGVLRPLEQLAQEAGKFNQQVAEASIFTAQNFAILGPDGKAIEGTANQMRAVRGVITKEYKEIQKEVANISGATAGQIIEGYNLLLQNSTALGKRGEDLGFMRKLSTRLAAGMNVLGIPNVQLRSEVNSLLTGDIQMYDQLSKKLGYDRATVERLKAEGKFGDDLMQRLEKLYQGQEVLSGSLANVKSNFEEFFQAVNAQGAQALERGLAGGLNAVQQQMKGLQGSFTGALRGLTEGIEPILRLLGEAGALLVPVGSILSSILQFAGDLTAVVTNLLGAILAPQFRALGGILQIIAKGFELAAAAASAVLRPLSTFLRILTGQGTEQVTSFFDDIIAFFDRLIAKANAAAAWVARPFVEMAKGVAWLQGKLRGLTPEEIALRQTVIESEFATSLGGGATPELRALGLNPETVKGLEERAARLGSGKTRQLNEAKELSQLVQDRIKNEIQGLEQALKLMTAQKGVQEALNQLAEGRRGLASSRAGFAVQLAASPEARLAAEERRNDLAYRQEQERISERRALLGTEREMLQTQLKIQLKQQQLQQEQLKIQRLELQIQRDKAQNWLKDIRQRMSNAPINSPEWRGLSQKAGEARSELQLRNQQLQILDRTRDLNSEMVGIIQETNGLEQQRLGYAEQQLDVQGQLAGQNRQQQAQLAELERLEQSINAERDQNIKVLERFIELRDDDIRKLQDQVKANEQLQKLAESRLEAQKAMAAASVQAAEADLKVAQAQQQAADNPSSVKDVVGAQIEALAAGARGLVSEADATRRLYEAKQRQLNLEQQLQRDQQRLQQERERSEQQIYQLNLKRMILEQKVLQERLQAEESLGRLKQDRDAMSGFGAPAGQIRGAGLPMAPASGAAAGGVSSGRYMQGGIGPRGANQYGPHFDIARSDGGYFNRNALDQYVLVNGRPLSSGLTVSGGQFGASRDGGTRSHAAWDYAFGGQAALTLTGGARWLGSRPGSYGDNAVFQTPDGQTYRIIHGRFSGTAAPMQPVAGINQAAPSLENSINGAAAGLKRSEETEKLLINQLRESNNILMPNLLEQQANQRQSLSTNQQAQQDALRLERIRAQLTAEVLNTSRGRLAAELTQSVNGVLGSSLRGVMAQLFGGEGFDLAKLSEGISRTMAERFTGALMDAALAPIEQALTENLFRTFSGVDVEERARQLAEEQMRAAEIQLRAAEMQERAATTGATAGGAVPGAAGIASVPFEAGSAAVGLQAAATPDVLLPSAYGLAQSMDGAAFNFDVVSSTASQAAVGFNNLMASLGRVAAVLGGVSMAVGGAQQMKKGGTYNTLMGLAGIFGALGSVTGLFAGPRRGGGSQAMLGFTGGLDFGISPGISSPVSFPMRAAGGPVTSNQPYVIGEQGPEIFVPSTAGMIVPNNEASAYAASSGYLETMGGASTARPSNDPIRIESRVINGTEYVTMEQLQQATREAEVRGAERGRTLTMNSLQNSLKSRKRIGLA